MRGVAPILVSLLALAGCAHRSWLDSLGPPTPVFLNISVSSEPAYTVTFDEYRVVEIQAFPSIERPFAKLSPREYAELSTLLANSAMEKKLAAYRVDPREPTYLAGGIVVVEHGLHRWKIPEAAIPSLPASVRAVLDFADRIVRDRFGERFAMRRPSHEEARP